MPDLVADTNIIFSALLKRGKIRRIILLSEGIKLHAPKELHEELHRLAPKLQRYLRLSQEELHKAIDTFVSETIELHEKEEYQEALTPAEQLLAEVDPSDTPFVALAMFLGIPLWTGDKGVLELAAGTGFKHFVAVDTEGVEMLLEGRSLEMVKERMREKYGRRKEEVGE